jgi:ubiquinone/menaquinone biosynthesis C-methylase UbiE
MKLNLCCGYRKLGGYLNVDKEIKCEPDLTLDLENEYEDHWPWEDNSVDEIICNHGLEHMGKDYDDHCYIIKEMYRVCKPDAVIKITVPHHRSDLYWDDPTHVRVITAESMRFLSKKYIDQHTVEGVYNKTPFAYYLGVDLEMFNIRYALGGDWQTKLDNAEIDWQELTFAINTYSNVVYEVQMDFRVVK